MSIDLEDIDNIGIDRVLKRGTGDILIQNESVLLVKDSISGALMMACDGSFSDISILDSYVARDHGLLMVADQELGEAAYKRYGYKEVIPCYQMAYYGDVPDQDERLSIRTADMSDTPVLFANYDELSEEEMRKNIERRSIVFGYYKDQMVGFIGEHLEGSIGMLFVFPDFRRNGFAEALERYYIARTIRQGFVPFGQVIKGNEASLRLQQKIGFVGSDRLIYWMWD